MHGRPSIAFYPNGKSAQAGAPNIAIFGYVSEDIGVRPSMGPSAKAEAAQSSSGPRLAVDSGMMYDDGN